MRNITTDPIGIKKPCCSPDINVLCTGWSGTINAAFVARRSISLTYAHRGAALPLPRLLQDLQLACQPGPPPAHTHRREALPAGGLWLGFPKLHVRQHRLVHAQHLPYRCQVCGVRFHRPYRLLMHHYHHTGEYPCKCRKCPRSLLLRLLEAPRRFACDTCGKKVGSAARLQAREAAHAAAGPTVVLAKEPLAPRAPRATRAPVASPAALGGTATASPAAPARRRGPECSECKKLFSTETLVQVHRRIHTGERPYPCPHCGKAFRPLLLHTGEPPYSYPDLGKSYRSFSNLWKRRKTQQQQHQAAVGLAVMETAVEALPLVKPLRSPLAEAEAVQICG
ncbi:Zinc finger protein 574 [Plecturocebus cupreus]